MNPNDIIREKLLETLLRDDMSLRRCGGCGSRLVTVPLPGADVATREVRYACQCAGNRSPLPEDNTPLVTDDDILYPALKISEVRAFLWGTPESG